MPYAHATMLDAACIERLLSDDSAKHALVSSLLEICLLHMNYYSLNLAAGVSALRTWLLHLVYLNGSAATPLL